MLVSVPLLVLASCGAPVSPASERDVLPAPMETSALEPALWIEQMAGDWIRFESGEGRFAAEFPRSPTRKTIPFPTAIESSRRSRTGSSSTTPTT